jgi:hypothetical protein
MAVEIRHAAWRTLYEVREILEGEPPVDLGPRRICSDYAEAVEFALEYLDEHDPDRGGRVSGLRVVRVEGTARETVWTYSAPPDEGPVHADPKDRWGFDVTRRWGPKVTYAAS